MAKKVKEIAVVKKPKEIVREIKGQLAFQRIGQGMATFKLVSPDLFSNPLVQVPSTILPDDYEPSKYHVEGEFIYTITITKK